MAGVLKILRSFTSHDRLCLQKFETIICAGLQSSHVTVAREMRNTWSATFGLQKSLALTEPVSRALEKSRAKFKPNPPGLLLPGAAEVCLK